MATKEANLKAIRAIEKERGIDVVVTGLSAAKVAALLEKLTSEGTASVAEEAQVVAEEVAPVVTKAADPVYVVQKGKALVCRRGVLCAGKAINVADISGGQKSFDVLVEKKSIVTKEEYGV